MAESGESETEPTASPVPAVSAAPAASPVPAVSAAPAAPAASLNLMAVFSVLTAVSYLAAGVWLGLNGTTAPIWLPVLPFVAVIAAYIARGQTARNGRGGSYLALIGLVLGYIGLALLAFGWALKLLAFG